MRVNANLPLSFKKGVGFFMGHEAAIGEKY
jgi:hypothetical protein